MNDKFLIQTENGPMRFRGDLIKKQREKLGLSEQEVGARVGLPAISVRRVEACTNVTIDTLLRVTHGVELKPSVVLKESRVRRAAEGTVR